MLRAMFPSTKNSNYKLLNGARDGLKLVKVFSNEVNITTGLFSCKNKPTWLIAFSNIFLRLTQSCYMWLQYGDGHLLLTV